MTDEYIPQTGTGTANLSNGIDIGNDSTPTLAALDGATPLNAEAEAVWEQALAKARDILTNLLSDPLCDAILADVFGRAGTDPATFEANKQALLATIGGDGLQIDIDLRSDRQLGGAFAAYAAIGHTGLERIYVNADKLNNGLLDVNLATLALLEEFGHALDWRLNGGVDSPGDEGQLFAAEVTGVVLTAEQRALIDAEDDTATLTIEGVEVGVEQAGETNSWTGATSTDLTTASNYAAGASVAADGNSTALFVFGREATTNTALVATAEFSANRILFEGSTSFTLSNTGQFNFVGASDGITQSSSAAQTLAGGIKVSDGPLTLSGDGAGLVTLSGTSNDYASKGLSKTGTSAFLLSSGNAIDTGTVTISGGTLALGSGTSLTGVIQLRGGVIATSGTFERARGTGTGNVNWGNGGGGFAAYGGPLTVSTFLGTWALSLSALLGNSPLILGSSIADNVVTLSSTLGLGAAAREIRLVDNPNSANDAAVMSGVISGTGGGLTLTGSGTLTLSGNNTYTGVTTLSGGVLSVATIGNGGVAGNLGQASSTGSNLVFNGGTLQYTGATALTNRGFYLLKTGTIDVTTNTLTMSGASNPSTGGLTKAGAGTLILSSNSNGYIGTTTISAGTLQIGAGGTSGKLSTSSAITNNATLTFRRSNTVTQGTDFNSVISGSGAVTQAGSGTLVLSGANTYSGTTTVSAGTLNVSGAAGALTATSGVNISGGTLLLSGSAADQIRNGASISLGAATDSKLQLSGAVTETLGALTLSDGVGKRVIDFGSTSGVLTLASLTAASPLSLQIWNWSGTTGTGGGTDRLIISSGRLEGSLSTSNILFYSDSGTSLVSGTAFFNASGELVPNEAPVITSGTTADFAENGTGTVYTVIATDADAGTTLTYSLSGTDFELFNIDGTTGAVTFKNTPNFESPTDSGSNNVYDINVIASDGSLIDTEAVAITVTNVNEAPVITSGTTADFAENGTGTVYTVTATDVDASTTLTYSLSGADAALFDITDGAVTFKNAPNFEVPSDNGSNNVYDINVIASDGALSDTEAVAITVTNVNEAPVITSATTANFAENGTGTVYTVTATDVDASTTLTYSLSGADAGLFNITNGAVTFITAPNFESPTDSNSDNVYDINVIASDGALSDTEAVAITVTNVNEAPITISSIPAQSLDNNKIFNYTLSNSIFSDPEGDILTYSVSNLPSWLSFNSTLKTFIGTANAVGTSAIIVSVNDVNGNITNTNFFVIVNTPISTTTSIDQSASTTPVTITGTANPESIFGGSANDTIRAGMGDDNVFGNAGNDKLYGDDGNDTLIGGLGTDNLYGRAGNDIFVLQLGNGLDVVNDFVDGVDKIGLSTTYSGGLTFGSVTISPYGVTGASTSILSGTTELMRLINVSSTLINVSDFTNIA